MAGADPAEVFADGGLPDDLKKAVAERALDTEMEALSGLDDPAPALRRATTGISDRPHTTREPPRPAGPAVNRPICRLTPPGPLF